MGRIRGERSLDVYMNGELTGTWTLDREHRFTYAESWWTSSRARSLSLSVENEWLCSRIMEHYGMAVPSCETMVFGKEKVLAVERFDRRLSQDGSWIIRLPQEDICQATGRWEAQKYENEGGPGRFTRPSGRYNF